jgi:hypothetical protein
MFFRFSPLPLGISFVLALTFVPCFAEDSEPKYKFEVGEVIITSGTHPLYITDFEVTLSWSGAAKQPFDPDEILTALMESLSEEEFNEFIEKFADFENPEEELTKYLEKTHEKNYVLSNYGGFFGMEGEDMLDFFVLDIDVTDSTIIFDIQNEAGGTWYLDYHKIHIGTGELGATLDIVNELDIVVARQIDDMIEGESVGGHLTKTGKGTLIIGGVDTNENNIWDYGLHIGGTLTVHEGKVVLAGVQEGGSTGTTHSIGNVVIGDGVTLDVQTGAVVELTGTEEYDVVIGEGGTLRVASSQHTGIGNTEKTRTTIFVNGGVFELYEGNLGTMQALSVDTVLGSAGGTVSIAAGLVCESGTVTGLGEYIEDEEGDGYVQYGDYRKTGGGTHIINGLDIGSGGLIISEGKTVLNAVDETQQAGYVVIGGGEVASMTPAMLDIKGGVQLQLLNDKPYDIAVLSGGTLRISSAEGTGIQKIELVEVEAIEPEGTGNETQLSLDPAILVLDGGTIDIHKDDTDSTLLDLSNINTVVGSKGGVVFVGDGITFIGGSIVSPVSGNLTKAGAGTHVVGNVDIIKGVYDVQYGTVEFTGKVKAGTLRGRLGTTIDMTQAQPSAGGFLFDNFEISGSYIGGGFDLTVGGGKVMGEEAQMIGVGHLTTKSGVFTLGAGEHSVQTLTVDGGNFNLAAGTVLHITNEDELPDIVIRGGGQLNIDVVSGAYFTKEGEAVSLLMLGGSVNLVNSEEATGFTTVVDFSNVGITLGEYEQRFNVGKGITLLSGSITSIVLAGEDGPGHYTKQGLGSHEINGVFINGTISVVQGSVILHDVGMEQFAASVAVKNGSVLDIQSGVDLTLTNMMSIEDGGVITHAGFITTKTLYIDGGGTLVVQAPPNVAATAVNTETLILGNGAKIDVGMGQLQLGKYSFENLVSVTGIEGVTNAHLATLNSHQTALRRYEWQTGEDRDSLNLMIEFLTVKAYTGEIGWSQGNVSAIAGLIDRHIGNRYLTDEELTDEELIVEELVDDESAEESDDETEMMEFFALSAASEFSAASAFIAASASSGTINSNREQLERLGISELNGVLRTAMAGELIGNAARIAMSSPHRTIFRHLESNSPVGSPAGWLGQSRSHDKMKLWVAPYVQSEKGKADEYTFDGYTLTRAGLMIGGDVRLTQQIVGGVAFQYGSPSIKSDLGKITADDYMVGAYMKLPVYGQLTVNGMVAYGMQRYSYQGPSDKAAFNGNIIFGSLEFTRPSLVASKLLLTPIVGVDFQSLGMDNLSVNVPSVGGMAINPDGLDTVAVRLGLQGMCYGVRARGQYIRQVSGNDYMISTVGIGSDTASLRSVQWGKDWVNVGLGCDLGQLNAIRLSADYDCDISKNTTSHIGSIKAVVTW